MVFASLIFLYLFLPLNLIVYFWGPLSNGVRSFIHSPKVQTLELLAQSSSPATKFQNIVLIAFSLVFYAWGEPIWVSLLIYSSTLDWKMGIFIEKYQGTAKAKIPLAVSLISNLALLCSFKYADLIVGTVNDLSGLSLKSPGFTLPIGISFYTFQTISYVIDVYRGEVKAQRRFMDFLLFVSLYPQLVAGPIVRYVHVAQEIEHRRHTMSDFAQGLHRMCFGLFKKVFIANVCGEWVHKTLDGDLSHLSLADAWLGISMFTLQIHFDFSAYSDMAIGLAKLFGFKYHENFNNPYIAKSATDFWRRWHISLGSFFRDYVYIPLGGNQRKQLRNLFIVWALTGLWHGASWNFMLWGLYFGGFIALERLFISKLLDKLPVFISHLYLLLMVIVGWAIFYFTDFGRLLTFLKLLVGQGTVSLIGESTLSNLSSEAFVIALALFWCLPVGQWFREFLNRRKINPLAKPAGWIGLFVIDLCMLLTSSALLIGQSYNPFLYFRF